MLKTKGIMTVWILLIFLAILIVGGFGYVIFKSINNNNQQSTNYQNDKYGFNVKLPNSWQGFKVTEIQRNIYGISKGGVMGNFPEIEIVHPLSTEQSPRQNIPIFVFTVDQWKHIGIEKDADWSVSAAPIPPSELGRNSKYVFALPARYNFAYLTGFEEVQKIIDDKSLTTFEVSADNLVWNIYQNEKYGFGVSYPSDWIYREYPNTKTGAGFRPVSSSDDIQNEVINVGGSSRPGSYKSLPFEQYVKIAAMQEIQGYESLASIEKVETSSGLVGYKTTWNYQTIVGIGESSGAKLSSPITYFDSKNSNNDTIQITLSDNKYAEIYNKIITSFKLIK